MFNPSKFSGHRTQLNFPNPIDSDRSIENMLSLLSVKKNNNKDMKKKSVERKTRTIRDSEFWRKLVCRKKEFCCKRIFFFDIGREGSLAPKEL